MPAAIINGVIQSDTRTCTSAGMCEWCGLMMQAGECVPVQSGTIITFLCAECSDILWNLGRDGLKELP
jgi:hypothetical protein